MMDRRTNTSGHSNRRVNTMTTAIQLQETDKENWFTRLLDLKSQKTNVLSGIFKSSCVSSASRTKKMSFFFLCCSEVMLSGAVFTDSALAAHPVSDLAIRKLHEWWQNCGFRWFLLFSQHRLESLDSLHSPSIVKRQRNYSLWSKQSTSNIGEVICIFDTTLKFHKHMKTFM